MPQYIFAYHGGKKPDAPEEVDAIMAKWNSWIDELGDAMVDPGAPVGLSKTVSAAGVTNDGGPNPLSGYSLVRADSMEAALEMAKSCPHLELGTIEIAPLMEM